MSRKVGPWHPGYITLIAVVFSIIPATVFHLLNFSRLGHPERIRLALCQSSILILLMILCKFRASSAFPLVWIIEISLVIHFYTSQIGLYRAYLYKGGSAGSIFKPFMLLLVLSLLINLPASIQSYNEHVRDRELTNFIELGDYSIAESRLIDRVNGKEQATSKDHYLLALVYFRQGKFDLANNKIEDYLALSPSDFKAQELKKETKNGLIARTDSNKQ